MYAKRSLYALLSLVFATLSLTAHAISDATVGGYKVVFGDLVQPFFDGYYQDGKGVSYMTSQIVDQDKNHKKIGYIYIPADKSKGVVVIVNGLGETFLKYKEVMYDLHIRGYSVFAFDHRGQGVSGRFSEVKGIGSDLSKVWVHQFKDYVDDFEQMVKEVIVPLAGNQPLFLLGHSMGGAISAEFLTREDFPKPIFRAAALSAPMISISTDLISKVKQFGADLATKLNVSQDNKLVQFLEGFNLPRNQLNNVSQQYKAWVLASALAAAGKGTELADGSVDCKPAPDLSADLLTGNVLLPKIAGDALTWSAARYDMKKTMQHSDPRTCMGETLQWVREAMQTTLSLQLRLLLWPTFGNLFSSLPGPSFLQFIPSFYQSKTPILLMQAGQDSLVDPWGWT